MSKDVRIWQQLPKRGVASFLTRLSIMIVSVLFISACGGGGGGTATGTGTGTPAPSVTFNAASTSLSVGQSASFTWSSSNAGSCQASGGWVGSKNTFGNETVGPLQQTTTFALSCSGAGGGTLREITVSVGQSADVRVTLDSDVSAVVEGGQAQISWTSTNADSCEASGNWSGSQALSGSFTTPALTADATYRLTCFAQGQSAAALLTVEVIDLTVSWQAPTENVDGSPLTNLAGFNVYWGNSSRNYSNNISLGAAARTWEMSMASGTYYLAITAIDSNADESAYSNEIRRIVP